MVVEGSNMHIVIFFSVPVKEKTKDHCLNIIYFYTMGPFLHCPRVRTSYMGDIKLTIRVKGFIMFLDTITASFYTVSATEKMILGSLF